MHLHRPHPTLAEPAPDAAREIVANIDNSRSVGAGIEGDIVHNALFIRLWVGLERRKWS